MTFYPGCSSQRFGVIVLARAGADYSQGHICNNKEKKIFTVASLFYSQ